MWHDLLFVEIQLEKLTLKILSLLSLRYLLVEMLSIKICQVGIINQLRHEQHFLLLRLI